MKGVEECSAEKKNPNDWKDVPHQGIGEGSKDAKPAVVWQVVYDRRPKELTPVICNAARRSRTKSRKVVANSVTVVAAQES